MEEKGIVVPAADGSDRRVKTVRLTQKGEECLARASRLMDNAEDTLVSGLSDDEVRTLIRLLEHMKENRAGESFENGSVVSSGIKRHSPQWLR